MCPVNIYPDSDLIVLLTVIDCLVNSYSDSENAEPLFYINGMMRTKITPNENKMIVSTLGGYFLLIHDLELDSLKADMAG